MKWIPRLTVHRSNNISRRLGPVKQRARATSHRGVQRYLAPLQRSRRGRPVRSDFSAKLLDSLAPIFEQALERLLVGLVETRVYDRIEAAVQVRQPLRDGNRVRGDGADLEVRPDQDDDVRRVTDDEGANDYRDRLDRLHVRREGPVLAQPARLVPRDDEYPRVHREEDQQRQEVARNDDEQAEGGLIAERIHRGHRGNDDGVEPQARYGDEDAVRGEPLGVVERVRDGQVSFHGDGREAEDAAKAQEKVHRVPELHGQRLDGPETRLVQLDAEPYRHRTGGDEQVGNGEAYYEVVGQGAEILKHGETDADQGVADNGDDDQHSHRRSFENPSRCEFRDDGRRRRRTVVVHRACRWNGRHRTGVIRLEGTERNM